MYCRAFGGAVLAAPTSDSSRVTFANQRTDWDRTGFDDQLDQLEQKLPQELTLIAELSWRCSPTDRSAARLARLATNGVLLVSLANKLTFGGWCLHISAGAFEKLLRPLVSREEYREAAVSLAHQRLSKKAEEWSALESLVLPLLGDSRLFKRSDMTEYAWLELAILITGFSNATRRRRPALHAKSAKNSASPRRR